MKQNMIFNFQLCNSLRRTDSLNLCFHFRTGDPTETEMDKILILTHDSYYVADFDDQIDKVTNYQRVNLSDIDSLEFGQPETTVSLFKNKNQYCIRINYKVDNEAGYFHMFRSTNLRFFNNMAVVIKTEEEIIGNKNKYNLISLIKHPFQ